MAIRDLFDLKDFEEEVSRDTNRVHFKKLKFKEISRKNISLRWNKFRLKRLREKLAESKFRESEIQQDAYQGTEKKVMKKAKKIADLEAKITFIETGKKTKIKFINTRALNLKNMMMKNLESNGEYIYSVSSSVADKIKSGNYEEQEISRQENKENTIESVSNAVGISPEFQKELKEAFDEQLDEERKNNAEAFASQESASNDTSTNYDEINQITNEQTNANEPPITQDNVKETIKNSLDTIEVDAPITQDDVKKTIKSSLDTIEVDAPITKDAIRAAIEKEMRKNEELTHISSYNSNSVINEDGTYRLKKEDIPDEIRIEHYDIEALDKRFKELQGSYSSTEDTMTEITPIEGDYRLKLGPAPCPSVIEEYNDKKEKLAREIPIIVSERNSDVPEEKNIAAEKLPEESIPRDEKDSDLMARLTRVKILKEEKARLAEAEKEAADRLLNTREELERQKAELSYFADSLEAECNESNANLEMYNQETAATETEINAILEMLGIKENNSETKKGRTK